MEKIKLELCKEFIKMVFTEKKCKGIEINCFFKMAEEVGLYTKNTYNSAMSKALMELVEVKSTADENGNFAYNVYTLK